MRASEILTENELNEYKIVDRLFHSKSLRVAERLFSRFIHQGMGENEAFHDAAKMANVGDKELQLYLQDHGLLST